MSCTGKRKGPYLTALADIVRQFRRDHGLNTKQAGAVLGLSARTIENIEQGRAFGHEHLLRLAIKNIKKSDITLLTNIR